MPRRLLFPALLLTGLILVGAAEVRAAAEETNRLAVRSKATRELLAKVHALAARVEEGDLSQSETLRDHVDRLRGRLRSGATGDVALCRAQLGLYHGYRALAGPGDDVGLRSALKALEPPANPYVKHVVPEIAVIERTRTQKRLCAITFDDGPNRKATPEILDILERFGAKATFFLLGMQVAAHPSIVQAIVNGGHSLGHHSYYHKKYTLLSDAAIRREWKLCDKAMAKALGAPLHVTLFRLPYNRGHSSKRIHKVLAERYDHIVGWSIDSNDYKERSTHRLCNSVLSHPLKKGAILLFHDHGAATLRSLETILRSMVEQGFRFVTVPELIGTDEEDGARKVFVRALRNLEAGQAKRAFYDLIWVGREFPTSPVADAALFFASNVARAYLGKTDFAGKLQALLRKRHPSSPFVPLLGGEDDTKVVAVSDDGSSLEDPSSARSE